MAFDYDSGPGTGGGSGISESFEVVSKNIKAYPYEISYLSDVVSLISYTTPGGVVDKTFNYVLGKVSSIVLSGATPGGIQLTKTFSYIGDAIAEVAYS